MSYLASTNNHVSHVQSLPQTSLSVARDTETSARKLTEERIVQRHRLNLPHNRIINKLRINIKKHRHIHRLPRRQPLLLKAKALDLAKVGRDLPGRDAVRRHADDVVRPRVGRGEEGQRRLARQHAHLALLRRERPGQHARHGAREGDFQAWRVVHGVQSLGGVGGGGRRSGIWT